MSADHALGIDIGTSGVRAALVCPNREVVAFAGYRMAEYGDNHRDPLIWEKTLAATLKSLFEDIDTALIGAVSVDGTSGTVLALDEHGSPVGDALMYNDAVDDAAIPARISKAAPRESAAHGAASALARAMELQSRSGVARIVHQADWLAELIAGKRVASDESNALKSGYDPVNRCWPDWIFDHDLLPRNLLPEVVPAGHQTGIAIGSYGIVHGTALIAGMTDGCASFMATGATDPGDAVTALGTTLTIKLLSDTPVFAPQYGIYSHRIGERWLVGGASNTGGGVLAAYFSVEELKELSSRIDPDRPTGLDYYPLAKPGERFPVNDPAYPPRLTPRPNDDAVFLQALFEGIAAIEKLGYQRLAELGAPSPKSLRTVGGGASNTVWQTIRRNFLDVPACTSVSDEAAAGVAQLGIDWLHQ